MLQTTSSKEPPSASFCIMLLGLLGGLSLAVYLAITLRYPLWNSVAKPLQDVGKINGYDRGENLRLITGWMVLFACYIAVMMLIKQITPIRTVRWLIVGWPLLFFAVQLGCYTIFAGDVYIYAMQGRVSSVYNANPFIDPASHFASDPFYLLEPIQYVKTISQYGPLWELVARLLTSLVGNEVMATVLAFKGLSVVAYFGNAGLIHLLLKRTQPAWTWCGLTIYLWNPLAIIEVAGNGHNDTLMMTGVLLALVAVSYGRQAWRGSLTGVALAAGVLLKFLPLLLAPLFWLAELREGLRLGAVARLRSFQTLYLSVVAFGSLLVLGYLPVWNGLSTLALDQRSRNYTTSLPTGLRLLLEPIYGSNWQLSYQHVSYIAGGLLLLWLGFQAWQLWSGSTTLMVACFEVFFFYLMFCCLWFQPWYLLWLITLAPLTGSWWIAMRMIIFSATAASTYAVWWMQIFFVQPNSYNYSDAQWVTIALIYPLPLVVWLYAVFAARRMRPSSI